jgi:ribonucleoside-diphosphate reductase beta chain
VEPAKSSRLPGVLNVLEDWLIRPRFVDTRRPIRSNRLPDCRELCRRFETRRWTVAELDFDTDQRQFRSMAREERQAWWQRILGILRGEVAAVEALGIYLSAIGQGDEGRYIATQIQDEETHVQLFERFQEAIDPGLPLDATNPGWTNPAYQELITRRLPAICLRLGRDRRDLEALVEAVTLLHLLIEGGLGMSRLRSMRTVLGEEGLFPGLASGLALAARDEVRHFLFGLRFLHEAVSFERECGHVVVRTVAQHIEGVLAILENGRLAEVDRTLRRLERGLHSIGVAVSLAA